MIIISAVLHFFYNINITKRNLITHTHVHAYFFAVSNVKIHELNDFYMLRDIKKNTSQV